MQTDEDIIPEVPRIIQNSNYVEHTVYSTQSAGSSFPISSLDNIIMLPESPEENAPIPDEPPPPYTEFESPLDISDMTEEIVSGDDTGVAVVEDGIAIVENDEEEFPIDTLFRLDEMINRPRWVIPVLPGGELELLINASINCARTGQDEKNAECMRFYREALYQSIKKILTDEAVKNWKADIQKAIRGNIEKLIELIVLKINSDNLALLDMLAMVFNQSCHFHDFNAPKMPEFMLDSNYEMNEDMKFATIPDNRLPKGWLVDFINRFGHLKGFDLLLNRVKKTESLTVTLLASILKPFVNCHEFLSRRSISTYLMPLISIGRAFLLNLSDSELRKESKLDVAKNEYNNNISSILTTMKGIMRQFHATCKDQQQQPHVETFDVADLRLEMILRLLRVSSFDGKMNALIEINKMLQSAAASSSFESSHHSLDSIPCSKLAGWISKNEVLSIVLRDNLHQPQYVDKLEKIIRFAIKEKALTLKDLDATWNAQVGKHEAIVKNVHELLAKLAWDFSPEQLDHLFTRFKESWSNANKKQREKLLALIRRLAEDDKEGEMAQKVLTLLWTLAKSENCAPEIVDLALCAHIKILDCSVAQKRDQQKIIWIENFIDQLKRPNDDWVLLALRMIRSICIQFPENPCSLTSSQQMGMIQPRIPLNILYRDKLINSIQEKHALVTLVANSLTNYMHNMKCYARDNPHYKPNEIRRGSRYRHIEQVEERLNFLCFVLKDGQLWLCLQQAVDIWDCLTQKSIYKEDSECCFRWFSKLISDEPDLDPDICQHFFSEKVLSLDTSYLSIEGITCFEHFFKFVNTRANKLKRSSRNKYGFVLLDVNLIGLHYLWRIIANCDEVLASKAVHILVQTFTNLSAQLKSKAAVPINEEFITNCMQHLKESFDAALSVLNNTQYPLNTQESCAIAMSSEEHNRMLRIVSVLREFIEKADSMFNSVDRRFLPLSRASCGKYIVLIVRIVNSNRQIDDFSVATHSNATVGQLRKVILNRFNYTTSNAICEIGINNTMIDSVSDCCTLGEFKLFHRSLILAKIMSCAPGVAITSGTGSGLASSDEDDDLAASSSSSIINRGFHQHAFVQSANSNGGNNDGVSSWEFLLPSTIFSQHNEHMLLLLRICDWAASSSSTNEQQFDLSTLRSSEQDQESINSSCNGNSSIMLRRRRRRLFESIRCLISLLPCDTHVVDRIKEVFADHACGNLTSLMPSVESLFYSTNSPNQVLYYLEVLYTLLLPATHPFTTQATNFRCNFVSADGVEIVLRMLHTKSDFLSKSSLVERSVNFVVIKLCKLLYCLVGFSLLRHLKRRLSSQYGSGDKNNTSHQLDVETSLSLENLEISLRSIPHCLDDCVLRQVAAEMVPQMMQKYTLSQIYDLIPNENSIKAVFTLSLCEGETIAHDEDSYMTSSSSLSNSSCSPQSEYTNESLSTSPKDDEEENEVVLLSCEALHVLTISFVLNPLLLELMLSNDHPLQWHVLTHQLLLKSAHYSLRATCSQQLLMLITRSNVSSNCTQIVNFFVSILFDQIKIASQYADNSDSFFRLACKLLEFARFSSIEIPNLPKYLASELDFINRVKNEYINNSMATDIQVDSAPTKAVFYNETFLCGRFSLCRELVLSPHSVSPDQNSDQFCQLIEDLFSHFLFPATLQLFQEDFRNGDRRSSDTVTIDRTINGVTAASKCKPICDQIATQNAAFQLLVALAGKSYEHFNMLIQLLLKYFYTNNVTTVSEWEFQPPIGCKAPGGFVGLKNAGATCYMNSVIQQLFMIPEIREGILSIPGVADDYCEQSESSSFNTGEMNPLYSSTSLYMNESTKGEEHVNTTISNDFANQLSLDSTTTNNGSCSTAAQVVASSSRIQYHITVLKYLQVIFGYLAASQLQFYTPEGFWKHFRFAGEPVNLREQQDALEFLNSIVDSVDEATKHFKITPCVFSSVISGSFADQKICKGCPHRYSREEPFTTVSVDVRNNQTLKDSLEQYVKGDLLEGDNAYFCEKCGKKVDTVKRMCIKKLPPVLIIQLKRFDYDWERGCAIKFNDYFEFPFQLDVEPYTVEGLARIEGEVIRDDSFETPPEISSPSSSCAVTEESSGIGTLNSKEIFSSCDTLHLISNEDHMFKENPNSINEGNEAEQKRGNVDVISMTSAAATTDFETLKAAADVGKCRKDTDGGGSCLYKLMGVVVHSGQASGGHYNSYIQCRRRDPLGSKDKAQSGKWYKFDDGDVSQVQIDEDDANELKSQWFGGDNFSEQSASSTSFEQSKRNTSRRQKRWWNAYLLFYEREKLSAEEKSVPLSELPNYCPVEVMPSFKLSSSSNCTPLTSSPNSLPQTIPQDSEESVSLSQSSVTTATCETASSSTLTSSSSTCLVKMPKSIAKAVQHQTILYAHNRVQFLPEYLHFIKSLFVHCQHFLDPATFHKNTKEHQQQNEANLNNAATAIVLIEKCGLLSMQVLCNVVFNTAFHSKKSLRGPASEWADLMITIFKRVPCTRKWLIEKWFLKYRCLISQYVLECPSGEVRQAIVKILVYLCHFCNSDYLNHMALEHREQLGGCVNIIHHPTPSNDNNLFFSSEVVASSSNADCVNLSDFIVHEMMQLMNRDVREAGKHLNQYFHFFLHYLSFGRSEKFQLLKMGVALSMVQLILDESNSNTHIKYQMSEFGKLYHVVSILVRCCDFSPFCASSSGVPPTPVAKVGRDRRDDFAPNPYCDPDMEGSLQPVSVGLKERLLDDAMYFKRIVEECPNTEETVALICYLSWENASFSAAVLSEILWHITFAYSTELKPYLDLLLEVLKIADSWQNHRINKALKGTPKKQENKDGLFETIEKSKTHFARRAYLSIKMLTKLFASSASALAMLRRDVEIRNQWLIVVEWLKCELNRNNQFGIGGVTNVGGGGGVVNSQNFHFAWNNNQQQSCSGSGASQHSAFNSSISNENANGYAIERSPSARLTLQKASEFVIVLPPKQQQQQHQPSPNTNAANVATTSTTVRDHNHPPPVQKNGCYGDSNEQQPSTSAPAPESQPIRITTSSPRNDDNEQSVTRDQTSHSSNNNVEEQHPVEIQSEQQQPPAVPNSCQTHTCGNNQQRQFTNTTSCAGDDTSTVQGSSEDANQKQTSTTGSPPLLHKTTSDHSNNDVSPSQPVLEDIENN